MAHIDTSLSQRIERVLPRVQKATRYMGGEMGEVMKDPASVRVRYAFLFPDVYEVGMSHLGMKILYHTINKRPDAWCERVFSPWVDMLDEMKRENIPLFSIESRTPVGEFDMLGVTLQYEMSYTNILDALEMSGIPLRSADRTDGPFVIAGGPCAFNPEPLADFFDIFVLGDVQVLDGLSNEDTKRYMHHYNFPPYSTGEAKPMRGPGRREIGHGALAERALEPMIPSEEEFPYAIRLVSEVMSSNGSTSQASVCGSTLSLMDAGVPIKRPVAGAAMGLIKASDDSGKVAILTDIQGLEDFLGDMDFKVAGTTEGITAIQMDIKIKGIDEPILRQALRQAHDARMFILGKMLECLPEPRDHMSKYAPKITRFTINPEKIREVIGPGGKMINKIIAETGVKIDIEDDGRVYISTPDEEASARARSMIEGIAKDPQVGDVFRGKVVRIMQFGAFVEFAPGKDGLVHISKLADKRVEKVEDVVNIGDELEVRVAEIDSQGRINLVRNDITYTNSEMPVRRPPRPSFGDRDRRPPRRPNN